MRQVLEGSHAVSEAVRLARVAVMSGYPIAPQTHIVEALSSFCADGRMDARFICVESEHSAIAAVIGAAGTGVRTFTATSSHGLAYMHELLHWTSGARLPIVMAEVNRALGPGWNIWADQTDSLAQRDTGWIQLYCEDGQEVFDTTLMAFYLAETVHLPVMVIMDAFFLSHTLEPVDIPAQEAVDAFLPPFAAVHTLDPANPVAVSQLATPPVYMEMRRSIQQAMERVVTEFGGIEKRFTDHFGRAYGPVSAVACEDADVIMVLSGSVAGTGRQVIDDLRARGEKVGLLKIKMFRPFPAEAIRRVLGGAGKVAVVDRNFSFGAGGIFAQEVQAALSCLDSRPRVYSYIAGLGGRDITPDTLKTIYQSSCTTDIPPPESVWVGLNEEMLET